jgi:glycosyltransferase involved in cell wall biosynthesis
MKQVFILVPALDPTGPVKGAVALANALVDVGKVTLACLEHGPGVDAPLRRQVDVLCLAEARGFHRKLAAYQERLLAAGGRSRVASLSSCFSADMTNLFCRRHAVTLASVRGNLLLNYRYDYGFAGLALAITHLAAMRWYDRVIAMNATMAAQIRMYGRRQVDLIGNFVDEVSLEVYRRRGVIDGPLRFIFLGSLTRRKNPQVLLAAMYQLIRRGVEAHLDVIGDGPLRGDLEAEIGRRGLAHRVVLHGQLSNPYDMLSQADAFVLPSSSEGLSRASLEALHLGVPCVLRNVDGNGELIQPGRNGALFTRDEELSYVMQSVALLSRSNTGIRESLLPLCYREATAVRRYIDLIESCNV